MLDAKHVYKLELHHIQDGNDFSIWDSNSLGTRVIMIIIIETYVNVDPNILTLKGICDRIFHNIPNVNGIIVL